MTTAHFVKERIALRYWLLGRGWYRAAEALDYAEGYHDGLRKDGVTPEFNHQVQIALYLSTLADYFLYPEETMIVAMLHDVCEDYDVEFDEIERRFGGQVATSTHALTKVYRGVKRNPVEVRTAQENDAIASIVKGADRIHNQSTMAGVFTVTKIGEYVEETETFILPMLKTARRLFPAQDAAYQNERVVLRTQNQIFKNLPTA